MGGQCRLNERNLLRRVETCFPIDSKRLRQRVIDDLEIYLSDNTQAWLLSEDGRYHRVERPDGAEAISAQASLLATMEKTL